MKDLELLLLRHGPTDWNRERRIQGHRDIPLSATARRQLANRQLPPPFRHWTWCTSPLRRAAETASLLGLEPPRIAPALIEMDWGEWEGHTLRELRDRLGTAMARAEAQGLDLQPPGGESPRQVRERVVAWLSTESGSLGAVTHKGVIRALLSEALDWDMITDCPIKPDWSKAIWLRRQAGGWMLVDYDIALEEKG